MYIGNGLTTCVPDGNKRGGLHQYFCGKCKNKRVGLLDRPSGKGGYAWGCPTCGDTHVMSYPVKYKKEANHE